MIGIITNYISKGVQNYNDLSKKFTWFKTNFNMPLQNYMLPNSPFTRHQGCWNYLTDVTDGSLDLAGFVPGYEVANACSIFDFENNSGSNYNVDTVATMQWLNEDSTVLGEYILPITITILPGYWAEAWYGCNIGCAGWEIDNDGTYFFISRTDGNPTIDWKTSELEITNCPSTALLGASKIGYMWVEGNNLCYICANQWKHTMVGTLVSTSPGTDHKGYMWIDSSNDLHWIGNNGYDYKAAWKVKQFASFYGNSATKEVNAGTSKKGYIWVDSEYGWTHLSYIGYDGYKYLTGAGDNPYA